MQIICRLFQFDNGSAIVFGGANGINSTSANDLDTLAADT